MRVSDREMELGELTSLSSAKELVILIRARLPTADSYNLTSLALYTP